MTIRDMRGLPLVFMTAAFTLACSERSGTPMEQSSVADYCDRVCNCASTATDECVTSCSKMFKTQGNTLGQDCLSCAQTTPCDLISTDCQDVCGGLVSDFPDAGAALQPDGGVPGCPTGRIWIPGALGTFLSGHLLVRVECGFETSVDGCVEKNAEFDTPGDGVTLECDPDPVLACLNAAAAGSCKEVDPDDFSSSNFPACRDAFETCCNTLSIPEGEGEGEEAEAEGEGESKGGV